MKNKKHTIWEHVKDVRDVLINAGTTLGGLDGSLAELIATMEGIERWKKNKDLWSIELGIVDEETGFIKTGYDSRLDIHNVRKEALTNEK